MVLLLVGHQFPLDRLAGSSDFALVVDDGSTQLTRISLSRAICPRLEQEVSTSLRWYPVVNSLGLLLQQQRLEILWYGRVRSGGSCTRWIVLSSPEPRVFLSPRQPRCVAQRINRTPGTHAQLRQQDSEVEETWQLRFESRDCERAGLCCCDVCWVPRWRPMMSSVQNSVMPFQRLRISPACGQVSSIVTSLCCPKNPTVVELCPSGDAMYSHPSSLSVLPVVSRFVARFSVLSIRSMQGFCVGAISFWCSVVRC